MHKFISPREDSSLFVHQEFNSSAATRRKTSIEFETSHYSPTHFSHVLFYNSQQQKTECGELKLKAAPHSLGTNNMFTKRQPRSLVSNDAYFRVRGGGLEFSW